LNEYFGSLTTILATFLSAEVAKDHSHFKDRDPLSQYLLAPINSPVKSRFLAVLKKIVLGFKFPLPVIIFRLVR